MMMTTRTGVAELAGIMRLRVIERFERDRGDALLGGIALGVPPRFPAHEERDLRKLFLGFRRPAGGRLLRRFCTDSENWRNPSTSPVKP